MQTTLIIVSNLFFLSILLNAYLFLRLKKAKKQRPESYELTEFIADMAAGKGLVEIKRVHPGNVFLRSTREMG